MKTFLHQHRQKKNKQNNKDLMSEKRNNDNRNDQ